MQDKIRKPGRIAKTLKIYEKYIGSQFGRWTVVGVWRDQKRTQQNWRLDVLCVCGFKKSMALKQLGRSKGCADCYQKRRGDKSKKST